MNEYEKARAVILDRNNSLPEIGKQLGIAVPTLRTHRQFPDKLKTASWEKVHKIAQLYKK